MSVKPDKKEAYIKFLKTNKSNDNFPFKQLTQYINDVNLNVNDMAEVEDINEIDLLNNIRNRYLKNQIFTFVGATIIVINPFQKIEGTFGETVIDEYVEVSAYISFTFTSIVLQKNCKYQRKKRSSHLQLCYDLNQ